MIKVKTAENSGKKISIQETRAAKSKKEKEMIKIRIKKCIECNKRLWYTNDSHTAQTEGFWFSMAGENSGIC